MDVFAIVGDADQNITVPAVLWNDVFGVDNVDEDLVLAMLPINGSGRVKNGNLIDFATS